MCGAVETSCSPVSATTVTSPARSTAIPCVAAINRKNRRRGSRHRTAPPAQYPAAGGAKRVSAFHFRALNGNDARVAAATDDLSLLRRVREQRRPGCPGRAPPPLPPLRPCAGAALRAARRAARRPRAGGGDRPAEGHRPLRSVARGGAHDLRDADHRRRAAAPLPRPGGRRPRAARRAGAGRAGRAHDGGDDRRARAHADAARARRAHRAARWRRSWRPSARSPRAGRSR